MSVSLQKIKLPDVQGSFSARTSAPQSKIDTAATQAKSKRGRPAFLARKVQDDQLFGESPKFGLGQISEEKIIETDELEEILGTSQVDDEFEGKGSPKNIFEKESILSSKYKEHNKGPMFSDDGHLVKHSIVGPLEVYERYQRGAKKNIVKDNGASFDKDNGASFYKDNWSMSEKSFSTKVLHQSNSFRMIPDQTPTSQSRLNTQNSLISGKKGASQEPKKPKKDIQVGRKEILDRVETLRNRQAKFYEEQEKKYKHLPLGDKLYMTKDKRCMQEFNSTVNNWDEMVETINSKIKRRSGKSIMMRGEEYREKVELAEAFDIVKSDHEKLGSMYWYMNLRNDAKKGEKILQRVINDIPFGFNCPQMNRPISSLERIRKPKQLSKSAVLLPPLQPPQYLDRTRNEYVMERSMNMEAQLSKIMTTGFDAPDEFLVEGKNKLDLEVDAYFKVNRDKDAFIVPKGFLQDKPVKKEEEDIVVNYDHKEIIKKGLAKII